MRYGKFDDETREYVITTPHTPAPWINYLGSQNFFSLISHMGGGYSFYRDARMRRLTRYRYNNVPPTSAAGTSSSTTTATCGRRRGCRSRPTWTTSRRRHGLGYTRITGERGGLRVESLHFVPLDTDAEIARVTVTNTSGRDQDADAVLLRRVRACGTPTTTRPTTSGTCRSARSRSRSTARTARRSTTAPSTASAATTTPCTPSTRAAVGFDTDRDTFVGAYNGLGEAVVPRSGASAGSVASGWYPIGSLSLRPTLAPGESVTYTFVLGYLENAAEAKWADDAHQVVNKERAHALLARFATTEQTDAAFEALRGYWTGLLSTYSVTSTDPKLDRMVNIWNQYQCMVTFNMSRSASYFETGIGRGMGFRDSTQDLLGFVHLVPERARERILDIAATQLPDGSAYHQYQPLTKRGNNDIGSGFNDDPLWLVGGRGRLPQGDRGPGDPRRAGAVRQRRRPRGAALRAPDPLVPVHPRPPRPARAAADRARGLERLPQPQLLLHRARRVLPDHRGQDRWRRGVGLHRHPVRALRRAVRRRSPSGAAWRTSPPRRAPTSRRCARRSSSTPGTAGGSCGPTTSTAPRSAATRTPRARSGSSRRASP